MSDGSRAPVPAAPRRRARAARRAWPAGAAGRRGRCSCRPSSYPRDCTVYAARTATMRAMTARTLIVVLGALGFAFALPATAAPAQKCLGAAARDPLHQPCHNARLRLAVQPTPHDAPIIPDAPCAKLAPHGLAVPCAFGAADAVATRRVALVGDSHAAHWRAALDVFATRQGWSVYALTRNSCALSSNGKPLPEPAASDCVRWKADVMAWLAEQPGVDMVFVSADVPDPAELLPDPPWAFARRVDGFVDAWQQLPSSIQQVFVLRD